MMRPILTALLLLQLGLAVFTWWPEPSGPVPTPLFDHPASEVTQLRIESISTRARGADIVLERRGTGWVLTNGNDFPADPDPVDRLVERLVDIKLREPVALQAIRHEQLLVTDEKPMRRVTLTSADDEVTFLMGASSHKHAFLRLAGQDPVYEIKGLGIWEVDDANSNYVTAKRLTVNPNDVASVTVTRPDGVLRLDRALDGALTSPSLAPGEALSPRPTLLFVQRLLNLKMVKPAEEPTGSPSLISVAWSLSDGTTGTYDVVGIYDNSVAIDYGPAPFLVGSGLTQQALKETQLDDLKE